MNVAIYCRVSTAEQAKDGYSIGEQQTRLKAYASALNWHIYNTYVDAGFSGSNTNRPALQQLIKDAKAGYIDKVVVYKLDRLSRSQKDTLTLIEDVFLANHCDFVSISENFDTSSPFGRAMIGILAVFAQLEREQIKERMQLGIIARAKEGKPHGNGFSPIGYDYKNNELIINDFERVQIKKVFEMYLIGTPIKRIARTLNESGLTHKYGAWTPNRVRIVLQNETYTGVIRIGSETCTGRHTPIIDLDTFAKASELMRQRSARHKQQNARLGNVASYLGGLLHCSHCGGKYSRITKARGTKKDRYYCCNSRAKTNPSTIKDPNCKNKIWKEDILNELIFSEIKQLSLSSEGLNERSPVVENVEENLKRELSRIEEQISRLLTLYADSSIPIDALQKKIQTLTEKKAAIEEGIKAESCKPTLTPSEVRETAATLEFALENGTFEEIRLIVESLIEYIELDNEAITIHWNF